MANQCDGPGKDHPRSSPDADGAPTPQEAAAHLLHSMRGRLRSILRRYRIPARDAEDLLQTTFTAYLIKQSRIHTPEAWIAKTMEYRCLIYWRTRRRDSDRKVAVEVDDPQRMEEILTELSEDPGPHQPGLRWDLERAVRHLPVRYARVLWLHFVAGCKTDEIAAATGYRPGSIRKTLSRALRRLRTIVEHGLEDTAAPPETAQPPTPEWKREALATARKIAARRRQRGDPDEDD